jgi:anti-sigma factor RsiW
MHSCRDATRAKGKTMGLAAELYLDSRSLDRRDVEIDATIRDQFSRPVDVTVTNLSRAGFAVEAEIDLTIDDELGIGIAGIGLRPATVIWRAGQLYGCRFTRALTPSDFERALVAENVVTAAFNQVAVREMEGQTEQQASSQPVVEYKLPLPARFAVVVGLSALLWAAIIIAVRAILSAVL